MHFASLYICYVPDPLILLDLITLIFSENLHCADAILLLFPAFLGLNILLGTLFQHTASAHEYKTKLGYGLPASLRRLGLFFESSIVSNLI